MQNFLSHFSQLLVPPCLLANEAAGHDRHRDTSTRMSRLLALCAEDLVASITNNYKGRIIAYYRRDMRDDYCI